jgi:hypothetical protein
MGLDGSKNRAILQILKSCNYHSFKRQAKVIFYGARWAATRRRPGSSLAR